MTNLNTTPNPSGKHSFRDNAVDSAANQTYEFDIDGSVAASVENTAAAKPKFGRRSFLTGFAGAALACMLAFGVQGAIIDPATAEATGTPSATQTVINTNDDATLAEAVAAKCLPSVVYVETYAEAAGLQEGDIITALDGESVEGASDLMLAVRGKNPGDTVKLTVNRNGQEQEISVTLGDDAASQKAAAEQKAQQEQQMPEQGQDFDWGYGDGNDYGYGWGYGDGYGQDGGNGYGYGDGYGNGLNLDDLFGQR